METSIKTCIRCRVSGKVQGVFFRARTREQALSLGLTGWVRNLANGDVEVVACGPEDQVAKLREWLWQGPELARVSALRCEEVKIEELDRFEIRY